MIARNLGVQIILPYHHADIVAIYSNDKQAQET